MARVTGDQVLAALTAFEAKAGNVRWPITGRERMSAMFDALVAAAAAPDDSLGMAAPVVPQLTGGIVTRCHALRQGDEMACGRCGLRWYAGDEDPPVCNPVERRRGRD